MTLKKQLEEARGLLKASEDIINDQQKEIAVLEAQAFYKEESSLHYMRSGEDVKVYYKDKVEEANREIVKLKSVISSANAGNAQLFDIIKMLINPEIVHNQSEEYDVDTSMDYVR